MRAERVAAPRLDRPVTTSVTGKVERVERLVGRGVTRITLVDEGEHPGLRVRVSVHDSDAAAGQSGARISLSARWMPPAPAAVPGGYEFEGPAGVKGIDVRRREITGSTCTE